MAQYPFSYDLTRKLHALLLNVAPDIVEDATELLERGGSDSLAHFLIDLHEFMSADITVFSNNVNVIGTHDLYMALSSFSELEKEARKAGFTELANLGHDVFVGFSKIILEDEGMQAHKGLLQAAFAELMTRQGLISESAIDQARQDVTRPIHNYNVSTNTLNLLLAEQVSILRGSDLYYIMGIMDTLRDQPLTAEEIKNRFTDGFLYTLETLQDVLIRHVEEYQPMNIDAFIHEMRQNPSQNVGTSLREALHAHPDVGVKLAVAQSLLPHISSNYRGMIPLIALIDELYGLSTEAISADIQDETQHFNLYGLSYEAVAGMRLALMEACEMITVYGPQNEAIAREYQQFIAEKWPAHRSTIPLPEVVHSILSHPAIHHVTIAMALLQSSYIDVSSAYKAISVLNDSYHSSRRYPRLDEKRSEVLMAEIDNFQSLTVPYDKLVAINVAREQLRNEAQVRQRP